MTDLTLEQRMQASAFSEDGIWIKHAVETAEAYAAEQTAELAVCRRVKMDAQADRDTAWKQCGLWQAAHVKAEAENEKVTHALQVVAAENEALRALIRNGAQNCGREDAQCCAHAYHLSPPSLREPGRSLLRSVLAEQTEKETP